jgi:hypothetical protein
MEREVLDGFEFHASELTFCAHRIGWLLLCEVLGGSELGTYIWLY